MNYLIEIIKIIIMLNSQCSNEKVFLGGKKSQKSEIQVKLYDYQVLVVVIQTKDRMFIDALCSPQSLVNRVVEYIIGGKTKINEFVNTPFKRVLNAYSDSNFHASKII